MREKLKRSIESMPRTAYIFLLNILRLCCLMLAVSALLFVGAQDDGQRQHLAVLFLENPAGILMLGLIGTAFFIDRS